MKTYPSIQSSKNFPEVEAYIFAKYDGSNLRFEWNKKKGWYKFGTRKRLFDESDPVFGPSISLFLEKYEPVFERLRKSEKKLKNRESMVAYAEFFGYDSFAGQHKDDKKDVMLFDVSVYKNGFLEPKEFVNIFRGEDVANFLAREKVNKSFIQRVRLGLFDRDLLGIQKYPEGIICKAIHRNKIVMCKIKTDNYLNRLKEVYQDRWKTYWE